MTIRVNTLNTHNALKVPKVLNALKVLNAHSAQTLNALSSYELVLKFFNFHWKLLLQMVTMIILWRFNC